MNTRNDCVVIIAALSALQEKIVRRKGFERVYSLSPEKFYLEDVLG